MYFFQTLCTVIRETPFAAAMVRTLQWVALGGFSERVASTISNSLSDERAGFLPGLGVLLERVHASLGKPLQPEVDRGPRSIEPLGHLPLVYPFVGEQHDLRPENDLLGGVPSARETDQFLLFFPCSCSLCFHAESIVRSHPNVKLYMGRSTRVYRPWPYHQVMVCYCQGTETSTGIAVDDLRNGQFPVAFSRMAVLLHQRPIVSGEKTRVRHYYSRGRACTARTQAEAQDCQQGEHSD